MGIDVEQITATLFDVYKRKEQELDETVATLSHIYSGLLDNSPTHLARILNFTETLAYAQSMYIQRIPGMPHLANKKEEGLYILITKGLTDFEKVSTQNIQSPNHSTLNPFPSKSLKERIAYAFEHMDINSDMSMHLHSEATSYIPERERWRFNSEPNEKYELLPSIAVPTDNTPLAQAQAYIKGIVQATSPYSLAKKEPFQTQSQQKSAEKKSKKTLTQFEEGIAEEIKRQRIAELQEEFPDFDPDNHSIN